MTAPNRDTSVESEHWTVQFAVCGRSGYWLTGLDDRRPQWGAHADAQQFDTLVSAWETVAIFQTNLWDINGASVRPWPVTEGYTAFVEPCSWCDGTGRRPEDNSYYLARGFTERACLSCWGYGERAIYGLSTVQLHRGGLFDGRPEDGSIHLVRRSLAGGSPGTLLCGIDFRNGEYGYSVGGGCSGPGWANVPCRECAAVAREQFSGLPVLGSVGGPEMAAVVGAPNRSTWDFRRIWRNDSIKARRAITQRALTGQPGGRDDA